MKLDQEKLKQLSSLSDEELMTEIRKMAEAKGLRLPQASPSHEDLSRLRALLTAEGGFGMLDAMRYYSAFKKKYDAK